MKTAQYDSEEVAISRAKVASLLNKQLSQLTAQEAREFLRCVEEDASAMLAMQGVRLRPPVVEIRESDTLFPVGS